MIANTKNNTITITEVEADRIYFNGLLKLIAGSNRAVLDRLSRETLNMERNFKINNLENKFNKALKKFDFNKAVGIYEFQFLVASLSTESDEFIQDVGFTLDVFKEFANLLNNMHKPTIIIEFDNEDECSNFKNTNYFRTIELAA